MESDSVSHSREYPSQVLLASARGAITTCGFKLRYQPVSSYATLDCTAGNKKIAENDDCGAGSCDPADSSSVGALPPPNEHRWCTPDDTSCWPTNTAIQKLGKALSPTVARLGVQWRNYPAPQPAPVPTGSVNNQDLYGLGSKGLRALYRYENIDEMQRPCFNIKDGVNIWNTASDICKAALHQNEYRNSNLFISQLMPDGILVRTILLKDKEFLPTWDEDPAFPPAGAFRFGTGSIFAEMHAFSAKYNRVVASG
ncbi:hypothetical protein H9Q74_009042 [Fusarium xylarioides]|nr:hypothetical protein H9Q71_011717 [Fusarium xylarioides]KAG5820135.1 hypothetical protein H9Q74_009042 [Fusarium xylarioides]